jgi:hypothetical protein
MFSIQFKNMFVKQVQMFLWRIVLQTCLHPGWPSNWETNLSMSEERLSFVYLIQCLVIALEWWLGRHSSKRHPTVLHMYAIMLYQHVLHIIIVYYSIILICYIIFYIMLEQYYRMYQCGYTGKTTWLRFGVITKGYQVRQVILEFSNIKPELDVNQHLIDNSYKML